MISKRKLPTSDVKAESEVESNINRMEEGDGHHGDDDCHDDEEQHQQLLKDHHKEDDPHLQRRKRKKLLRLCHDCQKSLPKNSFLTSTWRGPVGKTRRCKDCCSATTKNAQKTKTTTESTATDPTAIANNSKRQCHRCKEWLGKTSFGYQQWKGSLEKIRCCLPCYEETIKNEERLCHSCMEHCLKDSFSNVQWKGPYGRFRTCKSCVEKERPKSKKSRKKDTQKDGSQEEDSLLKSNNKCKESDLSKTETKTNTQDGKLKEKKKKEKKKKEKNFITDPVVIKQMISDRANTKKDKKYLKFQWDSFPISQLDENKMATIVVAKGCYGRISDNERSALSKYIKNSSTQMSLEQAISFRQVLLQQKAMVRHVIIQNKAKLLYEKYKKGSTIIELSKFIDCPPMNIFRSILTSMNYSKAKIKKGLRNPEKELKKREQQEFKEAESADSVSNIHHEKSRKFADAFEDIIAKFLKQKEISFVRQKELEKEQEISFGTPMLTPDFLILDTMEVNGNPVTWIDAKAFYGANIAFNTKKLKHQMSRYIDHWGSGAILYLQGFNEMLVMNGCTMLNAQSILSSEDLSPLQLIECDE